MPAIPYKKSHDMLIAGIGTADKYDPAWKDTATKAISLVTTSGFDPKHAAAAAAIRQKITTGSEATVFRAAAKAAATGGDAAGAARALSLKTLRHLYLHQTFGRQKVWILSLPTSLGGFPIEFSTYSGPEVDAVLNSSGEQFSTMAMKDLSDACQVGLSWVHKAMVVAGAPLEPANRKFFRRWFVPAGTANESTKITTFAAELSSKLQKIAGGLKSGEVILTDSPDERGTGSDLENSEAFVFTANDLIAVYIEKDFFGAKNTLTGKTNWARIIVHELTHAYAKTKDHSYSWQGLLPRDDDAFKSVNDKYVTSNPKFPAVRALTFDQCKDNADSWAFFCADVAGALSESDRIQALGSRLYDLGGNTVDTPPQARLRNLAA